VDDLLRQGLLDTAQLALRQLADRAGRAPELEVLGQRLTRAKSTPQGMRLVEAEPADRRALPAALYVTARPVTNAEFQAWFEAASERQTLLPPAGWDGKPRPPSGSEDQPVLGVRLEQAERYARDHGGRLPTKADYELLRAALEAPVERPLGDEFSDGFRVVSDP
jgi:formylglycine-generating enzyme required for sulfatase activity